MSALSHTLSTQSAGDLPAMIDRATAILSGARTAAEVLEAREVAGLAYDMAKRAARLTRAKAAHDDLIAAAHRAQADALEIEAAAKRRLADEYDAAQARGEVAGHGGGRNFKVKDHNLETDPGSQNPIGDSSAIATLADLGLRRDQIHDARLIRDAEVAEPGIVRRTLDERLDRGEEPTRSAVRRAAQDRLQRSLDRLQRIQKSVQAPQRQCAAFRQPRATPWRSRPCGVQWSGSPTSPPFTNRRSGMGHMRLNDVVAEIVGGANPDWSLGECLDAILTKIDRASPDLGVSL